MRWRYLVLLLCCVLCVATPVSGTQKLSAVQILQRVDDNQVLEHAIVTATMIIHGRSGTRTITSRSWILGEDQSFSEYLVCSALTPLDSHFNGYTLFFKAL